MDVCCDMESARVSAQYEEQFCVSNEFLYFLLILSSRIFGRWFRNPGFWQGVQLIAVFEFIQHHRALAFFCVKNPNIFVNPQSSRLLTTFQTR